MLPDEINTFQFPSHPCIVRIPSYTYIWLIFMVNVSKYTIHGYYGVGFFFRKVTSDTVMPGVRYDHSISFVQKRELPSANITEQIQELDTSCCQNQNPLLTKITLSNFKTFLQLLYLHWKKSLLAADCQGTVAAVSHSLIAMDKATYERNMGDSGWEYRFLEWICSRWCFNLLPW